MVRIKHFSVFLFSLVIVTVFLSSSGLASTSPAGGNWLKLPNFQAYSDTILSDGSWKSYDKQIQGWEDLSFDDSTWRNAYENYPPWSPVLGASKIWDWPHSEIPNGSNGPNNAWFRKIFTLNSFVDSAKAHLVVDDDFDFYLNSNLVGSNWDNTAEGIWEYDITSYLQLGENIIAIHAADTFGGYEHLEFKAVINVSPYNPYLPSNPSPSDGAVNQPIEVDLSWTSGDPDPGDTITYDVYFGISTPLPLVSENQTQTTYNPGTLSYNTIYYWQIVATDNHGSSTEGPIWSFTTKPENIPPTAAFTVSPLIDTLGTTFNFDASSSSDVEDNIENLQVRWIFEDDGEWDIDWSYDKTATHQYSTTGAKIIRLEVKDTKGATDTTTGEVTIFASPTVYTNPTDFEAATVKMGTSTIFNFEDIDASPVNNTFQGRDEFDGNYYANHGITFANLNNYPLYISPGGLFWNTSNSLSVGCFPFDSAYPTDLYKLDDDLNVTLNPPCGAVGFTLVDNDTHFTDEFVQFIDSNGNVVREVGLPLNFTSYRAFIGIISIDHPIAKIKIVEAPNDGDDVNYDNFICFFTECNPYTPSNPSPADGAINQLINVALSWTGGDPDPEDTVTYDVYFGISTPPPLVSENQTQTTYNPGTLSYNTTYYWQIVATDNHGSSTKGSIWSFTTGIEMAQHGLLGQYYNGKNFDQFILQRVDETINFYWIEDSPVEGVPTDNFSVRWTGWVYAPVSGNYKFIEETDDGGRLWVNEKKIIDEWYVEGMGNKHSGSIELTGDKYYTLTFEMYEQHGKAGARLYWKIPGGTEEIISKEYLGANPFRYVADVSNLDAVPSDEQITLTWKNPEDADFAGVLVIRRAKESPTGNPVDGKDYNVGDTMGDAVVVYKGKAESFTDTKLLLGVTYHYRIFTYDNDLYYSSGKETWMIAGWKVLFSDDFEDGNADGWDLESGWSVEKENSNYVLNADHHGFNKWAKLKKGKEWTDYMFRCKVKLIEGGASLDYRRSDDGRYTLNFFENWLRICKDSPWGNFFELKRYDTTHAFNKWYTVTILAIKGNTKVYVDSEFKFEHTDSDNPLLKGSIALESVAHEGYVHIHIDDIKVVSGAGIGEIIWSGIITPTGDTIYADGIKLEYPDGAVSEETILDIVKYNYYSGFIYDPGNKQVGCYQFNIRNEGNSFTKEVNLTFYLDIPEGRQIGVYYYDEESKKWILLSSTITIVMKALPEPKDSVSVSIKKMGKFMLIEYTPPGEFISQVSNYPNPFLPSKGQITKIRYTLKETCDVKIKIYDLIGDLVWTYTAYAGEEGGKEGVNEIVWDGRNGQGDLVYPGGYICLIKAGGNEKIRKIMVW